MTNLVAIATEFVPQDLRVRMALTKRRYRRNWILPFNGSLYRCRCSAGRGVLFPCQLRL